MPWLSRVTVVVTLRYDPAVESPPRSRCTSTKSSFPMSQPGCSKSASLSALLVASALVLCLLSGRWASSTLAQNSLYAAPSCCATIVVEPTACAETSSTTLRILAMGAAWAAARSADSKRSLARAVAQEQPATTVPLASMLWLRQEPMRALLGARYVQQSALSSPKSKPQASAAVRSSSCPMCS